MKRPSFQFYPSDWLRDTALRSCSTGARGLWMDMICYMHEGNPYGYLKVGNKVIHAENLSRMVGESLDNVKKWLDELFEAGVYDLDDGAICSRRMIRDENLRKIRAEGGKLGGNPKLKDNGKVNHKDKQKTTPSSSSSSSSSSSKIINTPEGVSESLFKDFLEVRKGKKAKWTETALKGLQREALKANLTLEQVMQLCCERGWAGFKAEWAKDTPASQSKDDKSWMFSNEGIVAKANQLGIRSEGLSYQQLKDKCVFVMTQRAMQ
mgnify:CR=1 FL=1